MGHLAKIENGIVTEVIVCDDIEWAETNLGGTWVQTSYNTFAGEHRNNGTALHKNFAGVGYTFDGVGFAAPQPFPSWTLNKDTYIWEPPISRPTDDDSHIWDEETTNWVQITVSTE